MSEQPEQHPADLLRRATKEERRLLAREQAAERDLLIATERLAAAELRLQKAQARLDRRRARVVAAMEKLRRRQAARAEGPAGFAVAVAAEPATTLDPEQPPARDDTLPIPADPETPTGDAPPRRGSPRRRSGSTS